MDLLRPPNCLAFRALFRKNSKTLPWNALVPDLVVAVITPELEEPYCGSKLEVRTLTSPTASGVMG